MPPPGHRGRNDLQRLPRPQDALRRSPGRKRDAPAPHIDLLRRESAVTLRSDPKSGRLIVLLRVGERNEAFGRNDGIRDDGLGDRPLGRDVHNSAVREPARRSELRRLDVVEVDHVRASQLHRRHGREVPHGVERHGRSASRGEVADLAAVCELHLAARRARPAGERRAATGESRQIQRVARSNTAHLRRHLARAAVRVKHDLVAVLDPYGVEGHRYVLVGMVAYLRTVLIDDRPSRRLRPAGEHRVALRERVSAQVRRPVVVEPRGRHRPRTAVGVVYGITVFRRPMSIKPRQRGVAFGRSVHRRSVLGGRVPVAVVPHH